MNNLEMADTLERAADLYESEQVDWCQKTYYRRVNNGLEGRIVSVCALGSIRLALVDGNVDRLPGFAGRVDSSHFKNFAQIAGLVARRLHLREQVTYQDAAFWNDMPEREKQEVIDLFKEIAKDLRNEG